MSYWLRDNSSTTTQSTDRTTDLETTSSLFGSFCFGSSHSSSPSRVADICSCDCRAFPTGSGSTCDTSSTLYTCYSTEVAPSSTRYSLGAMSYSSEPAPSTGATSRDTFGCPTELATWTEMTERDFTDRYYSPFTPVERPPPTYSEATGPSRIKNSAHSGDVSVEGVENHPKGIDERENSPSSTAPPDSSEPEVIQL
ncbi:hypothetical protein G7046_g5966 [Stylonectria norvegica]|nr:hypothetical protein G7046_g5966 [Stylonectria norvegica]